MRGAEIDQDSTIVGSLCYNHSEGRDMNEAQWKNLTQVLIFGDSYPRYWVVQEHSTFDKDWLARANWRTVSLLFNIDSCSSARSGTCSG